MDHWAVAERLKEIFLRDTPTFHDCINLSAGKKLDGHYFLLNLKPLRIRFLSDEVAHMLDFEHRDFNESFYNNYTQFVEPHCVIVRFNNGSTASRTFEDAECSCHSASKAANKLCPHKVLLYLLFGHVISGRKPSAEAIRAAWEKLAKRPTTVIDCHTWKMFQETVEVDVPTLLTPVTGSDQQAVARMMSESMRVTSGVQSEDIPRGGYSEVTPEDILAEEARADIMLCGGNYENHWMNRRRLAMITGGQYQVEMHRKSEEYSAFIEKQRRAPRHAPRVPPSEMSQAQIEEVIRGTYPMLTQPRPRKKRNVTSVTSLFHETNPARALADLERSFPVGVQASQSVAEESSDNLSDMSGLGGSSDDETPPSADGGDHAWPARDDSSQSSSDDSSSDDHGPSDEPAAGVVRSEDVDFDDGGYDSPVDVSQIPSVFETPTTASSSARHHAEKRPRSSLTNTPSSDSMSHTWTPPAPVTPQPKRGRPKGSKDKQKRVPKGQGRRSAGEQVGTV